jgi:heme/copper-type cytochrome/quinol oxidase subunit 3
MLEYARIGFNPADGAFGTIFFGLTGLHGAHVFVGLTLLSVATVRAFRDVVLSLPDFRLMEVVERI